LALGIPLAAYPGIQIDIKLHSHKYRLSKQPYSIRGTGMKRPVGYCIGYVMSEDSLDVYDSALQVEFSSLFS
jgi:hypothetical protein